MHFFIALRWWNIHISICFSMHKGFDCEIKDISVYKRYYKRYYMSDIAFHCFVAKTISIERYLFGELSLADALL